MKPQARRIAFRPVRVLLCHKRNRRTSGICAQSRTDRDHELRIQTLQNRASGGLDLWTGKKLTQAQLRQIPEEQLAG